MIHSKDMIEIQPVILGEAGPAPVYTEAARGSSRAKVARPGTLELRPNPEYVPGAYANLRHFEVRHDIKELGLAFDLGKTHLVPLEVAAEYARKTRPRVEFMSNGDVIHLGRLGGILGDAVRAGQRACATHIEIKIS